VHGAKGLEAPVVILPDCGKPDTTLRDDLLKDADGPLWKTSGDDQPERQRSAIDAAKQKAAQEKDRLLYVAMTRAEKWLIVAAAGDLGTSGDAWYEKVQRGMTDSGAEAASYDFGDLGGGEGWRLGAMDLTGMDLAGLPMGDSADAQIPRADLPALFGQSAPPPADPARTRSPSDLGGAKALPGTDGDSEDVAKARGTALHAILEHIAPLPDELRNRAATSLCQELGNGPDMVLLPVALAQIRDEALEVLRSPALAHVFAPETLAEVAISADLPDLGRIHGVIDRLVVTPQTITAVDFKSNRTVPQTPEEVPEGLLRQMDAYAAALSQIYPTHRIETALVWTATAVYMPLSHDHVTQSLRQVAGS